MAAAIPEPLIDIMNIKTPSAKRATDKEDLAGQMSSLRIPKLKLGLIQGNQASPGQAPSKSEAPTKQKNHSAGKGPAEHGVSTEARVVGKPPVSSRTMVKKPAVKGVRVQEASTSSAISQPSRSTPQQSSKSQARVTAQQKDKVATPEAGPSNSNHDAGLHEARARQRALCSPGYVPENEGGLSSRLRPSDESDIATQLACQTAIRKRATRCDKPTALAKYFSVDPLLLFLRYGQVAEVLVDFLLMPSQVEL